MIGSAITFWHGRSWETCSVLSVANTAAATNAVIECPQGGSFEWLAIIAFGEGGSGARRCFIVPAEMLSDGTFVRGPERGTIAIAVSKLMELGAPYINQFSTHSVRRERLGEMRGR